MAAKFMARARVTQVRFDDELGDFLFAFAGEEDPQKDTLELLNDMAVEFIAKTTAEAAKVARATSAGSLKITPDTVLYLARDDPVKYERLKELMESYDVIHKLRVGNARELAGIAKKSDKAAAKAEKATKQDIKKQQAKGGKERRARPKEEDQDFTKASKKSSNLQRKAPDPSSTGPRGIKLPKTSAGPKSAGPIGGMGGFPSFPRAAPSAPSAASSAPSQPPAERKTEFLM